MKKVIEIKNLNYSYQNGNFKLKDINLDIYENETFGIIGPNGSGKTTLILNLNGILIGNGEIKILEIKINRKNINEIRKKIGIVFQNPDDQLFSLTVFDDVAFGPLNLGLDKENIIDRVNEALKEVNMIDFINYFPEHLSFGEKKKISIATVLSMKPDIMIFDEPTIGLDPHSRKNLLNILKNLKGTKIIASHDLDMIYELCDRVVLINDGKIIKIGEKNEILLDKKLLEDNFLEVPLTAILKKNLTNKN
jgi:cobalt/nickel transport system ATP-binding protein